MPPKLQRRIVLSAGEECTICGDGPVQILLQTGVIDIAGALLEANRTYTFYLNAEQRSLVVFTLEGGSATVQCGGVIELHKATTGAAALAQWTRRTLLPLDKAKVLVIGEAHRGKTLAAHTICNLLRRYGSEESDNGLQSSVFLMDLNAETNSVYCPGCVSLVQVPEQPPLWMGNTSTPALLPLCLFTGNASRPCAKSAGALLHFSDQLNEMSMSYMQELCGAGRCHLVIDAPAPFSGLDEGVFYKKLIETMQPTHVVIVGGLHAADARENESWPDFLEKDVQRMLPDCQFLSTTSVNMPCARTDKDLLFLEYFVGSPYSPLGCSKVVVSSQALQFVELTYSDHGGTVHAQKVSPERHWRSLVCALSHAEIMEEVPLAPVAGLFLVSYVDEGNDEVVVIVPANAEDLLRRYVIVPSQAAKDEMRLTEVLVATVEESIAI